MTHVTVALSGTSHLLQGFYSWTLKVTPIGPRAAQLQTDCRHCVAIFTCPLIHLSSVCSSGLETSQEQESFLFHFHLILHSTWHADTDVMNEQMNEWAGWGSHSWIVSSFMAVPQFNPTNIPLPCITCQEPHPVSGDEAKAHIVCGGKYQWISSYVTICSLVQWYPGNDRRKMSSPWASLAWPKGWGGVPPIQQIRDRISRLRNQHVWQHRDKEANFKFEEPKESDVPEAEAGAGVRVNRLER